ncbi:Bgt-3756 [Blumeria graminis f. sp. tritici]|uniref:Bgt-3756 n=2 Tax=Blumeria graminis f. sp. tritici TaxID=62690 RepID=A0A061HF72_BLUGR|nr:hypothetical protein BGT96224_3756 [Blumeria graminis f. sp. tritici 96224]VCU40377.1 Bgt-3756 [Blumeria graminis f. sp. tritici]
MQARLAINPYLEVLTQSKNNLLHLNACARRHESSSRRNRSRLNVKPEPSFLLPKGSPRENHIIFNPPSSAPSVYETPRKFLPPDDIRKKLIHSAAGHSHHSSKDIPPLMRPKEYNPLRGHLKEADIAEIQRLNNLDRNFWTNRKLARKFQCSSEFVSVCLRHAGGDPSVRKAEMKAKWEYIQSQWGPRRRKAHEERQKRWQLALRDE